MAHVGEDALRYLIASHCLVVVLRPCHWEEDEDDVEQEEGGEDDEGISPINE